jgi:hypothetical protein
MKFYPLKISVAYLALVAAALGELPIKGALLIANKDVPAERMGTAALKDIYAGRTTYWEDGQRVVIAVVPELTDPALQEVSGMEASQFRTFWRRLVFSGRGQEPRKADDAAALVALVASTRGAVALVPADTALRGVKVIEIR